MINPIEFFKEQVAIWNETNHCGNCWSFTAPLTESGFNEYQLRDGKECCYLLAITDYRTTSSNEYNSVNWTRRKVCDHRIVMYIVKPSNIGINHHNEIDGHEECESKYESIIKPLRECFECDPIIDYCEIVGYPVQITQWNVDNVFNLHDNNYDGIKITAVMREIS